MNETQTKETNTDMKNTTEHELSVALETLKMAYKELNDESQSRTNRLESACEVIHAGLYEIGKDRILDEKPIVFDKWAGVAQ